jgi:hypothetical protein
VYYDCVSASTGTFNALNGSADVFQLGSAAHGNTIDAALDEVRLSRRALTANEIAAICRDRPLSRDKTIGVPALLASAPLGTLQPITGLLPNGTVSFTLNLTTTAPATCRWSEITATRYVSMPHNFQVGQGTTAHRTPIRAALDDRHFYVRCQDLATGRDPDNAVRQTHVRVLGPWSNRYPRVANLWNDFTTNPGADFLAGFDLHVVFGGTNQAHQTPGIRAANPNAKVLLTNATYGVPASIHQPRMMVSQPGDRFAVCCTVRKVDHRVVGNDNLPCRIAAHDLANMTLTLFFLSSERGGLPRWAVLGSTARRSIGLAPTSISDLNDQADTADDVMRVSSQRQRISTVRRFAVCHLMGNAASVVPPIVPLEPWPRCDAARCVDRRHADYRAWADHGVMPTFIAGSPELFYSSKFTYLHTDQMPPAMRAEAAASYARMRYGLATALMGNGLFAYDYGPDGHGDRWWYDEYGLPGGSGSAQPPTNTLPLRGYLGQPGGAPIKLEGVLHSADQVINGNFNEGLNNWIGWIDPNSGAAAAGLRHGRLGGSAAGRIVISDTNGPDNIEFWQLNKSAANRQYKPSGT